MKTSALSKFLNLLLEESDYRKTSYFAEKLMVSNKTISNYITELRYHMKEYELDITAKHGVGIRMEGDQSAVKLLQKSIQRTAGDSLTSECRRKKIMEKLLMLDESISVRRLSDEFCISSTSIVKDLEKVEQELLQQDILLLRTKAGTRIEAKEQRIRSAKRKFIFEEIMSLTQQDQIMDLTLCTKILSRYVADELQIIARSMIEIAQDKLGFRMDTNYYAQIFISYSIFIQRIKKGHEITEAPARPVVTELHVLKTYPITEEIIQWLKEVHHIRVNDLDIRWVNARLSGVYHEDRKETADYSPIILDTVTELISSIGDIFNADFISDELLKNGLSKHFIPMIARLKNNIKITHPFIMQIKQQYTAMFSVVSLASSILEKKLGFTLSDDEIGFILIHFQAALERHNLSKKIAVVYNCGLASAMLIENQIKINLPTFDVIELINIHDLKKEYLRHFDFIIATMELDMKDIPSVVISPVADFGDIQRIKQTYEKLIRNVKESRFPYLIQAISADTILVHEKCKTKEDILKKANEILLKKGYVEEEFFDSVKNREKISSTEIGNGIAIPHGSDKYVKQTSIVLITLEDAILWRDDMVSVILFTAVSFEQQDTMRRLLKDLYHLISSENFIEKIQKAASIEEILGIFYGRGL